MKKQFLYSILTILVCLLTEAASAGQYYKPISNRLGVWTDLGADCWLTKDSELKNSIGGGLGLGFGYEMQKGSFLLDVGVGANVLYNPVKMEDHISVLYGQDDLDPLYGGGAGEKLDYYYCQSLRQDKYLSMNIQIPVMLGFTKDRFFMLFGAKFGYLINLRAFCDANIDTKGYNQVIGIMENMPMYQFYEGRTKSETLRCALKPDVAVSVELGGYVGEMIKGTGYNRFRSKRHMRVSVFADYGLTQINQQSLAEPMTMPERYVTPAVYDMVDAASFKDVISSNVAGKLNNLFVGVKFTCMFDLPEPRECVLCKSDLKFVPRLKQTGKMKRDSKSEEKSSNKRR
ncbi:MAG: hypothetical protein MJZ75_06080 [Paludibacteraceae bacterium]|nr:hypothetical protein [Paludibacteraceae bacterium]